MITLIEEPTEENLIFGDDVDLEKYDIDEIVDFYVKMGPPDPAYMDAVRAVWEVRP
jgi:hypothetical protein